MQQLKFLQVGLGSMGKRRIRNLLYWKIPKEHIFGFDVSSDRCKEVTQTFGVKTFTDFKEAVNRSSPDAYIISTPPDKHTPYFLHAAKLGKHFFVEITTTDRGYKELLPQLSNAHFVAAPSCTFRFYKPVQKLKQILNNRKVGKILAYTLHLGQYLPDWHPWEDYRKVYFSQKETGAVREMFPHELNWLNWLVESDVININGSLSKLSKLDMTAEDILMAHVKYANRTLGNITIDVISHEPLRILCLLCENASIEWNWLQKTIRICFAASQKVQLVNLLEGKKIKGYIHSDDRYNAEIKAFLDAISGTKTYLYTFSEDFNILSHLKKLITA